MKAINIPEGTEVIFEGLHFTLWHLDDRTALLCQNGMKPIALAADEEIQVGPIALVEDVFKLTESDPDLFGEFLQALSDRCLDHIDEDYHQAGKYIADATVSFQTSRATI